MALGTLRPAQKEQSGLHRGHVKSKREKDEEADANLRLLSM